MLFNKEKKLCFWQKLFIVAAFLFVPCFLALKNTNSASAVSMSNNFFQFRYTDVRTPVTGYQWSERKVIPRNIATDNNPDFFASDEYLTGVTGVDRYEINWATVTTEAGFATIHFETNLVWWADINVLDDPVWASLDSLRVEQARFFPSGGTGTILNIESSSVSYATTSWDYGSRNTLTIYVDLTLSGVPQNSTGTFNVDVGIPPNSNGNSPFYLLTYNSYPDRQDVKLYVEQNPTSIIYSSNLNDALLNQQIAQQEVLIQIQLEQQQREQAALDNISGQSASDISGATNAQTTSIITTISNFVTALSSIQTGSCELTLPFPSFIGGSQVVNPCTGKEKAPTIVAVGSSMFLIGVFIPFAFIVLKMIYNEIRSFTNG